MLHSIENYTLTFFLPAGKHLLYSKH